MDASHAIKELCITIAAISSTLALEEVGRAFKSACMEDDPAHHFNSF